MVVVKADGYGHGMVPVARAARAAGAEWLGVSTGDEALALRRAGDTGRLLCWLAAPGADYRDLIEADVDVTAYSVWQVKEIVDSARRAGRVARVQIKFDTGLSRGGAPRSEWPAGRAGRAHRRAGGQHPGHRAVVTPRLLRRAGAPGQRRAVGRLRRGVALAARAGLDPEVRHLANSGGRDPAPRARHDLVRLASPSTGSARLPTCARPMSWGWCRR